VVREKQINKIMKNLSCLNKKNKTKLRRGIHRVQICTYKLVITEKAANIL
jgi:hypothetical protein